MKTQERRIYLTGNTYPVRDRIREAGGHWDPERKQWWVPPHLRPAMLALAEQNRRRANAAAKREHEPEEHQKIVADATVVTKDHRKTPVFVAWLGRAKKTGLLMARLVTRDGREAFWAFQKDLRITRRYEQPLPLAALLNQLQNA